MRVIIIGRLLEMDIGAKLKSIAFKFTNLFYKKKFLAACMAALCFILICTSIFVGINYHQIDMQEKSPFYPIASYDYITTEDNVYSIDDKLYGVPAFFRTDFASIPQFLWFLDAPYKASFVYPAIWHDYAYVCPGKFTRKDVDDIFYNMLRFEGNSFYTSFKMYLAVRLFGGFYFNENGICEDLVIQMEADEKQYNEDNPNHG
jgi:hypothetical protein